MAIVNFYIRKFEKTDGSPNYLVNQGSGNLSTALYTFDNQNSIYWVYDCVPYSNTPSTQPFNYRITKTLNLSIGVIDTSSIFIYTGLNIGSPDRTRDSEWTAIGWNTSSYAAFRDELCNTVGYAILNSTVPVAQAYRNWNLVIYYNYQVTGLTGLRHTAFFWPGNDSSFDDFVSVDL